MSLLVSSLCEEWLSYGRGEEPKRRILSSRWTSVFSLCQKKTSHRSQVHMKPHWLSPVKMYLLGMYLLGTEISADLFQFSKKEINNLHKTLQWGQLPGMKTRMNGLQPFHKLPAVSRGLLPAPCRPPFRTRSAVCSVCLNGNLCLNAAPGHLSTEHLFILL